MISLVVTPKIISAMELEKLVAIGTQLGLSGADLRKWIDEQEKQRKERVLAREAAEREKQQRKSTQQYLRECEVETLRLKLELQKLRNEHSGSACSTREMPTLVRG